jgi:poly-beta-1,6-N-acetyl-D-glucosamine synthase
MRRRTRLRKPLWPRHRRRPPSRLIRTFVLPTVLTVRRASPVGAPRTIDREPQLAASTAAPPAPAPPREAPRPLAAAPVLPDQPAPDLEDLGPDVPSSDEPSGCAEAELPTGAAAPREAVPAAVARTARTVAIIPAHDEERDIAVAIRSVRDQVDEVVVVADNCTDATEAIAADEGATVFVTRGNRAKKAGALNQALDRYLPTLDADDFVLLMDADSAVCEGWVELALGHYSRASGGISGAYMPREVDGFVPLLQRVEYAQERRRIARRHGRVDVLSGVASIFSVRVLREIADKRGGVLPGRRGQFYDESSLTEDFEITVALRCLGYRPRSPKDCAVETDVMPTWSALYTQRIRWQRGTLETLREYPRLVSLPLWLVQVWTYLRSLVWPLMFGLIAVAASYGVLQLWSWWLLMLPLMAVDQLVTSWRGGWKARLLAASLLPGVMFDNFRGVVYWTALWKALRKHTPTWIT